MSIADLRRKEELERARQEYLSQNKESESSLEPLFPKSSVPGLVKEIADSGEQVNADWNATTGRAVILNKPTTIAGYGITDHKHMGGVTNYTEFDSAGHQEMFGTARPWRDELGDVLTLQRVGVGITSDAAEAIINFDYNSAYNTDYLYKNVQLNHDKDLASSLYAHIHWFQAKNYSPNFLLEYRWQVNGGAKVTSWTPVLCNTLAFTYTAGTIHQIAYAAAIAAPVGSTISDIVQFRIYRDTANTSTLFAGTCPYNTGGNASTPILSFDIHFQINSLGSDDEYTK